MDDEIDKFFKVGKNLGIKENEIKGVFNAKKSQISIILLILLPIVIVVSSLLIFFFATTGLNAADSTYPSGSRYSTTKIKDFKKKNEIKYRVWKKIRDWLLQ